MGIRIWRIEVSQWSRCHAHALPDPAVGCRKRALLPPRTDVRLKNRAIYKSGPNKRKSLINPQTQNPYAYALNNPVNLGDPSGEQAQILENQAQGAQFENYCLNLFNQVKNTGNLMPYSSRIPDILNLKEGVIGEIKSGRYTSLSPQMKDIIQYAGKNNMDFTLYAKEGSKQSKPLPDAISAVGGQVVTVGGIVS